MSYKLTINCNICSKILLHIEGSQSKDINLEYMHTIKDVASNRNICKECLEKESL